MSVVYIYGLVDPRNELTIENVRYVGKTKGIVWRRLCKHVQDSKTGIAPVHKWIRKLKLDNQRPVYIILEQCDENTWKEAERKYITLLRKSNRLLKVRQKVIIIIHQLNCIVMMKMVIFSRNILQ